MYASSFLKHCTYQYIIAELFCSTDIVYASAFKFLLIKNKMPGFSLFIGLHESQIYWLPVEMNTVKKILLQGLCLSHLPFRKSQINIVWG